MGNGHDLAAAAPRAARQERMRDQLWVRGQIWHRYRRQRPWPVEILLDTCAGGGSYMSLALWRGLRKLFRRDIDTGSPGFLEAANPSDSETPPMRILVSAVVPVLLESDYRVRNVVVRVVEDLPYGFIFGADHFRRNHSTLEFAPDKGFRPVPSAPWVPFHIAALDTSPHPNPLRAERNRFFMPTPLPETPLPLPPAPVTLPAVCPSYLNIAWEDESTLEWDIRQVAATTKVPGFTSIAVEPAAVGPQL